jgi:hypothetical protein
MKLELLNSEGPILVAEKIYCKDTGNHSFILTFPGSKKLGIESKEYEMSPEGLDNFLNGNIEIEDLDGKKVNYSLLSDGMKPGEKDLNNFLNHRG